ncbi:MAG: T9SS type A sorting domain-containing protein [Ignavibacteriales bacterium]|nr:T9SS type A sorting domain-containing protein [Ignavibacteriales bacterium]
MKHRFLLTIVSLMIIASFSFGQLKLNRFETAAADSQFRAEGTALTALSTKASVKLTDVTSSKKEGNASMSYKYSISTTESWGEGFVTIIHMKPRKDSSGYLNGFGANKYISLWYNNVAKAHQAPDKVFLRMKLWEDGAKKYYSTGQTELWVYQDSTKLFNMDPGWNELKIPLVDLGEGTPDGPNASKGFTLPTAWGFTKVDGKLEFDKILGYAFDIISPKAPDGTDSVAGEILFDNLVTSGDFNYPVVENFDGAAGTSGYYSTDNMSWDAGNKGYILLRDSTVNHAEGTSSLVVDYQVNATQGWGGYVNFTREFPATVDLSTNTSLLLIVKNIIPATLLDTVPAAGKPRLTARFILFDKSSASKREDWFTVFDFDITKAHNDWVTIRIPLQQLDSNTWNLHPAGFQNPDGQGNDDRIFSTTKIGGYKIEFSINGSDFGPTGTSVLDKGMMMVDLLVPQGYKESDVTPPVPPTGVAGIPGSLVNVVTWTDVPGEVGAKYNVYFSEQTFTNYKDATVEDLPPYDIPEAMQASNHVLRAPVTDQNITYYYGVNAKDKVGNEGQAAISSGVTNLAKGVPTISKVAPANYTNDANLNEWTAAGFKPIIISKNPATGEGHVNPNGTIDNDNDLLVKAYLAVDNTNLYVAYDITDDIVSVDSLLDAQASYAVDCPDLFIGLYDWRGKRHLGLARGATPDYHFRFSKYGLYLDNPGNFKVLARPGVNYTWKHKTLTAGYTIEARIPFQLLVDSVSGDQKFVPVEGKRIPIDFSLNDNDGKTFNPGEPWNARDGILCYSPFNNDNSYQDMWHWTYTWIGEKWVTGVVRNDVVARSFELTQNYPNPFNPTTTIKYSVPVSGFVSMKIYDVLGREVMTVVGEHQDAGSYTVSLDASKLATGMYVYRLDAGASSAVKKMMLVK